jgi:hypothetical protein
MWCYYGAGARSNRPFCKFSTSQNQQDIENKRRRKAPNVFKSPHPHQHFCVTVNGDYRPFGATVHPFWGVVGSSHFVVYLTPN